MPPPSHPPATKFQCCVWISLLCMCISSATSQIPLFPSRNMAISLLLPQCRLPCFNHAIPSSLLPTLQPCNPSRLTPLALNVSH
ncbi:hypothetical protein B0H19DRAFT_1182812 [Mycena capillaripes]|nr:hypothetical protein B0H19DRAFT_1182812 [Mycena capillaripes]